MENNVIGIVRNMFPKQGERKPFVYENVIFIDPGKGGTGFAFFEWLNTKPTKKQIAKPTATGAYAPKRRGSALWQSEIADICFWFAGLLESYNVETVVLEYQAIYQSAKGNAAAQKGDIQKLTYLTGGLGHVSRLTVDTEPALVLPRQWKGQLPKDVVLDRVEEAFGIKCQDHEGDAVGMGLSAQGLL